VGEEHLDHPLVYDRIRQAPDFRPHERDNLFLPRIKQRSELRVKESQDFGYVVEDVMRTKARMRENQVSLDIAERRREITEADERQRSRNAERRERFAKVEDEDRKNLKFSRITLDDINRKAPLARFDPTEEDASFMRRAKSETEELDDTPQWPSRIDPVRRESLMALRDLAEVTEAARMAGLLKRREAN